jgi:hypothetical protein
MMELAKRNSIPKMVAIGLKAVTWGLDISICIHVENMKSLCNIEGWSQNCQKSFFFSYIKDIAVLQSTLDMHFNFIARCMFVIYQVPVNLTFWPENVRGS